MELQEIHIPVHCTEATAEPIPYAVDWSMTLIEGGAKVGLDFSAPKKLETLLQIAGYQNIVLHWKNFSIGTWAKGTKNKQIGRWWAEDFKDVSRNAAAVFTRVLGWKLEEYEVLAANIANEVNEGKKHMWTEVSVSNFKNKVIILTILAIQPICLCAETSRVLTTKTIVSRLIYS